MTLVGKPIPAPYTTQVTNGSVLLDIINKVADEDPEGPFNRYVSTYHGGLGHSVTAFNGTAQVSVSTYLRKLITTRKVCLRSTAEVHVTGAQRKQKINYKEWVNFPSN